VKSLITNTHFGAGLLLGGARGRSKSLPALVLLCGAPELQTRRSRCYKAMLRAVCLQRCRACACAARVLCAVRMHWGRPPAELRAGVRWAKLAWRFGCVGAVRRKRPAVLHCWRQRLGAGGGGEGEKEG
jgi:hypothetical protein